MALSGTIGKIHNRNSFFKQGVNMVSKKNKAKLFVIDTNVLLHDPQCLYNFEENDIALPIIVLEELDNHKRGVSDVARNARQANRLLDRLLTKQTDLSKGIDLIDSAFPAKTNTSISGVKSQKGFGKLYFCTDPITDEDWEGLSDTSNDNKILAVVRQLIRTHKEHNVILVSKDINIRVKAMALGLKSEDYTTDQAIEDSQLLYNGFQEMTDKDWSSLQVESWADKGKNHYRIKGKFAEQLLINQAVFIQSSTSANTVAESETAMAMRVTTKEKNVVEMQELSYHNHSRTGVWGIVARNREQNVALNYLIDPNIDLVTILGAAGTGKTLLTLASGLHQVFDLKRFEDIIITRATVPIGDDIGFLPGTEEEKMNPWMGALDDNLKVLSGFVSKNNLVEDKEGNYSRQIEQWEKDSKTDMLRAKIKVKSLSFMRGRTFVNRFLIIDEAQNLTAPQLKSLITRAGPGTKVICLGNLAQIDTPYLTPLTSGLTWLVERFKNWQHCGHLILQRGERSRLATYAEEVLAQ